MKNLSVLAIAIMFAASASVAHAQCAGCGTSPYVGQSYSQPVYSSPVYNQGVVYNNMSTFSQPVVSQPMYNSAPVYSQPMMSQPVYNSAPVYNQPIVNQPVYNNYSQPVVMSQPMAQPVYSGYSQPIVNNNCCGGGMVMGSMPASTYVDSGAMMGGMNEIIISDVVAAEGAVVGDVAIDGAPVENATPMVQPQATGEAISEESNTPPVPDDQAQPEAQPAGNTIEGTPVENSSSGDSTEDTL